MQAFDPRPVRAAAFQALFFLAGPGSLEGAQLLWARAGVAPLLPMLPASTHAVLQLVGGFLTLIFAFLAHGVPHLLGLDLEKSARARWAIRAVGALLVLETGAELAHAPALVLWARGLLVVAAIAFLGLLVAARLPRDHDFARAPVPALLLALALVPVGLLLWTWEARGGPAGLASDLLLYGCVVPVILSMGFQMFASMLRLPDGRGGIFFVAMLAWALGAAVRVLARVEPELLGLHAPLLLLGALLWLLAMNGLRRRQDGPVLPTPPSAFLRTHIVVAVATLALGSALGLWPRLAGPPLIDDLARHLIALGFVLHVTMGVTLSVLPRFCRGRPSSSAWAHATVAAAVLGLLLRAMEALEGSPPWASVSAGLSWLAVLSFALHLGRGLRASASDPGPNGGGLADSTGR